MPAPPGWGSLSLWAPLVRRAPGPLRARARAPGSGGRAHSELEASEAFPPRARSDHMRR